MADSLLSTEGDVNTSGQFESGSNMPVNIQLLELESLKNSIRQILPFWDGGHLSEQLNTLLESSEAGDLLRKFIGDPQVRTFSIQRQLVKGLLFFNGFLFN